MVDEVKWWQYPPEGIALAAKMKAQGHFWDYIAKFLYVRYECPYYDPEWLGRAVRAAQKAENRPPAKRPERRRATPPIPEAPRVPSMPEGPPLPPVDLQADWAKAFPDIPWPGEKDALPALMRADRRRR